MTETAEETYRNALVAKFPVLAGDAIKVQRPRRVWVTVPMAQFAEVFAWLAGDGGMAQFLTITGLDEGENFSCIYHLAADNGMVVSLKTPVPRANPVIESVTPRFPVAEVPERELADLFGIVVKGLPPGFRYPLSDDWPAEQYPLRKDWKPSATGTVATGTATPVAAKKSEVKS